MSEPTLPRDLGDVIEDALAQVTGLGRPVRPLGLDPQNHTLHGTTHDTASFKLAQRTQELGDRRCNAHIEFTRGFIPEPFAAIHHATGHAPQLENNGFES